jgi:peptidyl-prolyl cis-trans isomerase B (cyclophilin B)
MSVIIAPALAVTSVMASGRGGPAGEQAAANAAVRRSARRVDMVTIIYRTMTRILCLVVAATLYAQKPAVITTPYSPAEMRGKQAVVETSRGAFVMELLPDAAPNHVGYFMKLAREGAFAKTLVHRVIRYGIIQGGDPLSRDPAKTAQYGTGGLGVGLKPEINKEAMTAGAVAAVLIPNRPDSAGAQFFVCVTDQAALQGQYTIFARVVEGIEIVQQISAVEADAKGLPATRIEIVSVTIRDTPPPLRDPFADATAADLAAYRLALETTKGRIELAMLPDKAPETVRQILRLASAGVFDGVAVHRVVPGFVIQTGSIAHRAPLTAAQQKLVRNLAPEFTDTPNLPGIVSMARGDDPASATTSFFICVGECRGLDGQFTVFARVASGMDVVQAMAAVPVDGETPKESVTVIKVIVSRVPIS